MRSLKLPNQYFRILRINTEQPSDPKAGYSRSELKHVDLICNLVDGALGEYETRIAALLDDQSADARLARLDGGKPEEVQLKVQQIQDVCNQGIEEVDTELGMVESEIVLEDDQFTWWKKNWESRDSFNGFTSARKAVFARPDRQPPHSDREPRQSAGAIRPRHHSPGVSGLRS